MKNRSGYHLIGIFAILAVFSFSSCNQGGKQENSNAVLEKKQAATPLTDEQMKEQKVFDHYIEVKDAMVTSNPAEAKDAAQKMKESLQALTQKDFRPEEQNAWDSLSRAINASLDRLTGTNDLKQQRAAFNDLSDNYFVLLKKFDIVHTPAYRDFCPMAFNSKGAYWISNKEEIKNPYFGEDMLDCGELTDTIRK